METPSQFSQELLDAVKAHLDAGQFKEALELPNDNRYAAALKDNCWDLIPYLLSRIDNDTIIRWPALQRCCEKLLLIVAEKANAEEVLLELIERGEVAKNDAQFIAMLKPLQTALIRATSKNGRSFEWCVNTITEYIRKLEIPEDNDLTEKSKLLMDCDENARRILKVYNELPIFYDYFLDQISNNRNKSVIKDVMVCFLIDLLGKPFAYLDMEFDGKTKPQSRVLVEQIFKDLCSINEDLFKFLPYIRTKCNPPKKSNKNGVYEDASLDIFLMDEKLSPVSLGVLYYLLLSEKLSAPLLPQIYSVDYIFQEVLFLAVYLLKQDTSLIQYKGLKLSRALTDRLPKLSSSALLVSSEYNNFVRVLCVTAVYSSSELVRKGSVVLLKDYILKFDDQGRFMIIKKLIPTLQHSGIKGYIVNIYKDVLLESRINQSDGVIWFIGKHLQEFLRIVCELQHGAETDLVEWADYVISVLNLLRFLALKDSESNDTGFWDCMKYIEEDYLVTLKKGLEISRAHYEVKLRDLSNENKEMPKMSITVSGSVLNNLPNKNQKEVINSGLNALHLIDCLLSRLQECISARKQT